MAKMEARSVMSGKREQAWTHLSRTNEQIILREVEVSDDTRRGAYKPAGFWYEVGGDWRSWCEAENFGSYRYIHSVELNDCNVLIVDTLEKLDVFHERYGRDNGRRYSNIEIDWKEVSQKYDGLEIAPYQYARRLAENFSWYYGWDCASGVIWRPRNASVTYIGVYEPKTESREIANA